MILLVTQQRDIYNTSNSGNVEKGDLDVILLIVCCLWGCVVSLWHLISLFSNNEYLTEGNSSTFTAMRNVLTCRMEKFPVIPLLVYKSTHGLSVRWAESCPCCSQPMVAAGRYHLQSVAAAHQREREREGGPARCLTQSELELWAVQTCQDGVHSPAQQSSQPPPHPLVRPAHRRDSGEAAVWPSSLEQGGGHQLGGERLLQAQPATAQPGQVHDERQGRLSDDCGHVLQQSSSGGQDIVQRLPDQTREGHQ